MITSQKPASRVFQHQTTTCAATGQVCPEAEQLVQELARSMTLASPFVEPQFEVRACGRINGCQQGCNAEFFASLTCVRLFCGIAIGETDKTFLDDLAEAAFRGDQCAIARLRRSREKVDQPTQPCLIAEAVIAPGIGLPAQSTWH